MLQISVPRNSDINSQPADTRIAASAFFFLI